VWERSHKQRQVEKGSAGVLSWCRRWAQTNDGECVMDDFAMQAGAAIRS
jgi:hypothetical protein